MPCSARLASSASSASSPPPRAPAPAVTNAAPTLPAIDPRSHAGASRSQKARIDDSTPPMCTPLPRISASAPATSASSASSARTDVTSAPASRAPSATASAMRAVRPVADAVTITIRIAGTLASIEEALAGCREVGRVGALGLDLVDHDAGGVEQMAVRAARVLACEQRAVGRVAAERMAEAGERRADLVQEAGARAHLDERHAVAV